MSEDDPASPIMPDPCPTCGQPPDMDNCAIRCPYRKASLATDQTKPRQIDLVDEDGFTYVIKGPDS